MYEQVNANEAPYLPMSLLCERCRNQVFTLDSFRAAWNATGLYGGFSYTTTWSDILNAAELGCGWCRVLQDNGDNSQHQVFCTVIISFSEKNSSGCTPEGVAHLRLIINRFQICSFWIYTEAGKSIVCYGSVHAPYDREKTIMPLAISAPEVLSWTSLRHTATSKLPLVSKSVSCTTETARNRR